MPSRPFVTLHGPMAPAVFEAIATPAREAVEQWGFKWWIGTGGSPGQITMMIDSPQVWCERAPTEKELARFQELWEAGDVDAARELARHGLPKRQR